MTIRVTTAATFAVLVFGFAGCTDDDPERSSCDAEALDAGTVPDVGGFDHRCVWNQAYQENTVADSVGSIIARARGCYVLLDPFDCELARDAIRLLQDRDNTIGCYISVGTCEDWREDFDALRADGACSSREWPEWQGEFFVTDVEAATPYMIARIDTLAAWGCDFVEFDNMDWAFDAEPSYQIGVDPAAAAAYNAALCDRVHEHGMRCMAKSTREGAQDFDGLTVESYTDDLDWWTAEHMEFTLDAGQPGIVIHYGERGCGSVEADYRVTYGEQLSFLCEDPDLGGYRH
jgi:hypothetical protein